MDFLTVQPETFKIMALQYNIGTVDVALLFKNFLPTLKFQSENL